VAGGAFLGQLIEAARDARENAYCPYSGFAVGAAVLTEDGLIYGGCNVENASYGLSLCAERAAIATAVSAGMQPGEMVALALVADAAQPVTPCGACRQVIIEFAAEGCRVVSSNLAGEIRVDSAENLLPEAFSLGEPPE